MDNNKPPPPLAQGGPQGATPTNPPAQGHSAQQSPQATGASPTGNASTSINRPRRLPNTYTEDERNRIHRFLTFEAPRQVACYDYVLEGNYWDFPSLAPKMSDFEEFEEMHAWWAQNREKYYRATELNMIFRAKQLSLPTAPQPAQSSSASAAHPASGTVPAVSNSASTALAASAWAPTASALAPAASASAPTASASAPAASALAPAVRQPPASRVQRMELQAYLDNMRNPQSAANDRSRYGFSSLATAPVQPSSPSTPAQAPPASTAKPGVKPPAKKNPPNASNKNFPPLGEPQQTQLNKSKWAAERPKDLEFPEATKKRMAEKNGKEILGAMQGLPVPGLWRGNRPSLLDPALDNEDAWLAARPGEHHKHHLRPGGQLSTYMEPPLGGQWSSRSCPELLNLCRNEDPHICTGVFIDEQPCQFLNTPRQCAYWHWMPQEILDEIVTKRGVSHNFVQSLITNYEQRVPKKHQDARPKLRIPTGASAFAPKPSDSRASRPAPRLTPEHAERVQGYSREVKLSDLAYIEQAKKAKAGEQALVPPVSEKHTFHRELPPFTLLDDVTVDEALSGGGDWDGDVAQAVHALSQQQGSGEDANQAEQDEEAVSPVPGSDDEDDIKAFSSDEE